MKQKFEWHILKEMPNKNLKENKIKRFFAVLSRDFIKAISKTQYVKWQYKYITHHKLNLKNPVRYTEKLQYLRLFVYPYDKEVIRCASRATVRDYVKEKGFADTLIPIYGLYDDFDEIDFTKLTPPYVLKCTHACAFNYIVRDSNDLNDLSQLRKKFKKWLRTNYGKKTVELHYSPIKPQIIIEKYIGDIKELPIEYKIHVFNGVAKSLYVVTGRGKDIRYNNLYIDWKEFDGSQFNGWKKREEGVKQPDNFQQMVQMAEELAKPFPFVRIDLYNIAGKIYFSEMTFTPAKGTLILDDDKVDFEMGKWLNIEKYINSK